MGTKIIRFCDACEDDEGDTPPFVDNTEAYTISVSGYSPKVMDLCQHHYDTLLGAVLKAMVEIGRDPRPDAMHHRSQTPSQRYGRKPAPGGDSVECPTCHQTYTSRLRMTQHHRRIHKTLAPGSVARTSDRTEMTCPECGKVYQGPAGLGSHRFHAHGIEAKWKQNQKAVERFQEGQQ